MGIPDWLLMRMAGAASVIADPSRIIIHGIPIGPAPYGDDPRDQQAIRDGIEFGKRNGYGDVPSLTPTIPNDGGDPFTGMPWPGASIPDPFNNGQRFLTRRDPLTLDLDGDGIETVGTNAGVLFDHDADGISTGTGWVGADDGFLVWDKNGNGSIDTGRELFGDSFIKANGQLAANGFDALSDLDSNSDGLVNSSDANWNNLRVWVDADTDGVTDAGELKTLTQLNIVSFNTTATQNLQTLPNGNQVADLGSYTRTDGSQSGIANVYQKADINLAEDTFHRVFNDSIPIASDVIGLPSMQGSGRVRTCARRPTI